MSDSTIDRQRPSPFTMNDSAEQLSRYRLLAQISSDWFWETDEHYTVTYMSESVERITGYPPEQYIGQSRYDLASEETRQSPEYREHVAQVARREPIKNFEYKHVGVNGQVSYLRVNAIPLFHDTGEFRGYLGTTTDITELVMAHRHAEDINRRLEQRTRELEVARQAAEKLAQTDALTGLSNRRAFFEAAHAVQREAHRLGRDYSIVMLDIDSFKQVNDHHGHPVGDRVLQLVAVEIGKLTRNLDVAGRLGGEEFALVLPETSADEARQIAERLRGGIAALLVPLDNCVLRITSSFGVASCTRGSTRVEDLLAQADLSLYRAKSQGRNRVVAA